MYFKTIPSSPENVSGVSILKRLIDGLGFRYYWATESLTDSSLSFRPCESSMDMMGLMNHIHQLAFTVTKSMSGQINERAAYMDDSEKLRKITLDLFQSLSENLKEMSDEEISEITIRRQGKDVEFSFWYLINGPIADALTHVGQITSWRRINNDPVPKHNPFLGQA